ncbi:MAG: hypothetical protein RDU20_11725 [Desulfomonilaceae bacterium]|nr:hypothetical protein [Desulfomonilaceae bacterium]
MKNNAVAGMMLLAGMFVIAGTSGHGSSAGESGTSTICRPQPAESGTIELGMAGQFSWTCTGGEKEGNGYYIVFIRPSGTYVLLKVPVGRTSFEFTPDTAGLWRWIVINTDPDGTKPDMESEPGYFQVIMTR